MVLLGLSADGLCNQPVRGAMEVPIRGGDEKEVTIEFPQFPRLIPGGEMVV